MKEISTSTIHEFSHKVATGSKTIEEELSLFTSKSVLYYDDVIDDDFDDGFWPRPGDDDDDRGHEPHCLYMDIGADNEEEGNGGEPVCQEKPEFYLELTTGDPLDDKPEVKYYCPRHFALNLGYLCDRMARRTPEMEQRRFVEHGELPDRYAIRGWGRI